MKKPSPVSAKAVRVEAVPAPPPTKIRDNDDLRSATKEELAADNYEFAPAFFSLNLGSEFDAQPVWPAIEVLEPIGKATSHYLVNFRINPIDGRLGFACEAAKSLAKAHLEQFGSFSGWTFVSFAEHNLL